MPASSNTMMLALVGGGAFVGGYSGIVGNLGIIPAAMVVPVGCLVGAAGGNVANSLVNDTAIDYKGSFMMGAWAFGGSFAAGLLGGSLGLDPVLLRSLGGAAGGLIGAGAGGISAIL